MNGSKLIDSYNRRLNYLRVSVTDRCNLHCMYCAPPRAHVDRLAHSEILRYEEILRIIRAGVRLGVTKVRITGGEPLVRKGICDFLRELGEIPEIRDISLTTNAVLLRDNILQLRAAGIRRLNISLDSLNRKRFAQITGHDRFEQVWEGIMAAHEAGFSPIKINTVAMNGINDDELADIARLSFKYPFHMRFIEYMPIGDAHLDADRRILAPEIMSRIAGKDELVPVAGSGNDGPAERYRFRDAPGEVGFIRPLSHHFCDRCNRLRLTASGQLRPCLLSDRKIDIKTPLRNGCTDDDLARLFLEGARFKPMEHHIGTTEGAEVRDVMSSIGG